MKLNNKYFLEGLLFIFIGVIFILWNFDIINIDLFLIFRLVISVGVIIYGIRLYKYYSNNKTLGKSVIAFGVLLLLLAMGVDMKFIFAVVFLGIGIYLLFYKSKVFKFLMKEKGVFKDSRDEVYIREKFATIKINNTSNNLSKVRVIAYFSNVNLDFSNTTLGNNQFVDFEVVSVFSNVNININYIYNVKVNGEYTRSNRVSGKDFNIKIDKVCGTCNIV